MPAISVAVLAAFSTLPAFAVFPTLAVAGVPGLGPRPRGVWRSLGGRLCSVLGPCSHQFFQLATVKPDTPAIGTHVELNPGPIHSLHGAVVIGAKKQRHRQVPQYERRDSVQQPRASVKSACPTSPRPAHGPVKAREARSAMRSWWRTCPVASAVCGRLHQRMDGSCRPSVDHCEVQGLGLWSDLNDNAFDVVHLQGRARVSNMRRKTPSFVPRKGLWSCSIDRH